MKTYREFVQEKVDLGKIASGVGKTIRNIIRPKPKKQMSFMQSINSDDSGALNSYRKAPTLRTPKATPAAASEPLKGNYDYDKLRKAPRTL